MDNNILVSVLMTAYNREKYIAEAIDSVLASSYTNFELIIVDDFSDDNTVSIARKYKDLDRRVKIYINEKNLGDYPNRNKAASYATGEFLMTVDSDDIIFKESIEKCISLMMQHPDVSFGTYYRLPATEPFVLDSATALHQHFFKTPYLMIGPGGTIIRRSFFKEIGGYPEIYGPANDMYFNLKAAAQSKVLMIPFEIYYIRKHAGQEINNAHSYLYNNYRYNRDSFNYLDLRLDSESIQWLHKKNKRRFLVSTFKYLIKTKNLRKTMLAIRYAEFSLKDAFIGLFH